MEYEVYYPSSVTGEDYPLDELLDEAVAAYVDLACLLDEVRRLEELRAELAEELKAGGLDVEERAELREQRASLKDEIDTIKKMQLGPLQHKFRRLYLGLPIQIPSLEAS